jgi:hypothetical protein
MPSAIGVAGFSSDTRRRPCPGACRHDGLSASYWTARGQSLPTRPRAVLRPSVSCTAACRITCSASSAGRLRAFLAQWTLAFVPALLNPHFLRPSQPSAPFMPSAFSGDGCAPLSRNCNFRAIPAMQSALPARTCRHRQPWDALLLPFPDVSLHEQRSACFLERDERLLLQRQEHQLHDARRPSAGNLSRASLSAAPPAPRAR